MRRHRRLQPARRRALRGRRPPSAGTTVPLQHPPALQAASGQRPDSSPGTNSPLDCLCPGSAAAPLRFGVRITSLREVSGPPLRDHGVLAPNAKLRALVVPQEVPQAPEPPAQEAKPVECEANCAHHRPVRLSWAKLLKRVLAAT